MLRQWDKQHPGRTEHIFSALGAITPSHMLDRSLFDFQSLKPSGEPDPEGDIGFDVDPVFESHAPASDNGVAPVSFIERTRPESPVVDAGQPG